MQQAQTKKPFFGSHCAGNVFGYIEESNTTETLRQKQNDTMRERLSDSYLFDGEPDVSLTTSVLLSQKPFTYNSATASTSMLSCRVNQTAKSPKLGDEPVICDGFSDTKALHAAK